MPERDTTKFDVVMKTADAVHKVVFGEVYTPEHVDTYDETITKEDIQAAAWGFISSGRYLKIDVQHDNNLYGAVVVESYIARGNDPDFTEGSWVLGVKLTDELWDKMQAGEINGYSLEAKVQKFTKKVLVEVATSIAGITEKSESGILPPHEHAYTILNDEGGKIIRGHTDVALGHMHVIRMGTATESELDHNHRYSTIMIEEGN